MKSRLEQAALGFKRSADIFRCPLCGAAMDISAGRSFLCDQGHCFDLAAKGYVNLLGRQKPGTYDKELFVSRRAVMSQGFYDDLTEEIKAIVRRHAKQRPCCRVVDAGCGEGWYLRELREDEALAECDFLGLDIVRDAIRMAAGDGAGVNWCVADLARLPLQDNSVDIILNILSPANYQEFKRVLKADGLLVKVVPGNDYLREIRALIAPQLIRQHYSNQEVLDYSDQHISVTERRRLCRRYPLSAEQRSHFLRMTPLTAGVDLRALPLQEIDHITIDLELLSGSLN